MTGLSDRTSTNEDMKLWESEAGEDTHSLFQALGRTFLGIELPVSFERGDRRNDGKERGVCQRLASQSR